MRNAILIFFLIFVGTTVTSSQSTSDNSRIDPGSVRDNVYTNRSLGINWDLPNGWVVDSTLAPSKETRYPLLRLSPDEKESAESVELSYAGQVDSGDVIGDLESSNWKSTAQPRSYTLGSGLGCSRVDLERVGPPTEYRTIFICQRYGQHLIFSLIATSPDRINELVRAVLRIRVQPDWGTPDEPFSPTAPGAFPKRVRISQGVSQSLLQKKVQPKYPDEARKTRIQGSVIFLAHISTDGNIKNLYLLSGHPLLAPAALDAVSQWTYRPYLLQGIPVEVETQITINFTLQ
jgi:TonB family protein